jgi:hypothetical protein
MGWWTPTDSSWEVTAGNPAPLCGFNPSQLVQVRRVKVTMPPRLRLRHDRRDEQVTEQSPLAPSHATKPALSQIPKAPSDHKQRAHFKVLEQNWSSREDICLMCVQFQKCEHLSGCTQMSTSRLRLISTLDPMTSLHLGCRMAKLAGKASTLHRWGETIALKDNFQKHHYICGCINKLKMNKTTYMKPQQDRRDRTEGMKNRPLSSWVSMSFCGLILI